jgi:sec-independent protein translocase protein TatA
MLGLDNPLHLAFLLAILLLVFGAKRLPELGRSLGAGMRGFKDSISGEGSAGAPSPTHMLESPGRAAPVETTPLETTPLETTATGREAA